MKNNEKKPTVFKRLLSATMPWAYPVNGTGNILAGGAPDVSSMNPVMDQTAVRLTQPKGTLPTKRIDRTTGYSQLPNLSHKFSMEDVQSALRMAEQGDVRKFFAYLRDWILSSGFVVSELSKRKMSTLSESWKIIPHDKAVKDDVNAAKAIHELLMNTPELMQSFSHMMNAVVYPISVSEKIFEEITSENWMGDNEFNLRWKLKKIYAVDYNVLSYKLPYFPMMGNAATSYNGNLIMPQALPVSLNGAITPEDITYDVDLDFEPELRIWQILPLGTVMQVPPTMMALDPMRFMVYRCNLLNGIARENFGGVGKSLLFLAIMSQMGLDIFLKCLQKYGLPFVKIEVDTAQVDTVNQIMETFGNLSNVLNVIAVNKGDVAELMEMNYNGAAEAHERFIQFINDIISNILCGQSLGSKGTTGGLGTGKESLQSDVRNDIIQYDRACLNKTLQTQVFSYLMKINGIKGHVPSIVWGQSSNVEDNVKYTSAAKNISDSIYQLAQAGYEFGDNTMNDFAEKLGFTIKKSAVQIEPNSESSGQNSKSLPIEDKKYDDNKDK